VDRRVFQYSARATMALIPLLNELGSNARPEFLRQTNLVRISFTTYSGPRPLTQVSGVTKRITPRLRPDGKAVGLVLDGDGLNRARRGVNHIDHVIIAA
jgi:hypothetical protein